MNKKSEARKPKIIKLTLKGYSEDEIAEKLGVSRSTISRDKRSIHWGLYTGPMFHQLLDELNLLKKSSDVKAKSLSLSLRLKLLLSLLPKKVESKVEYPMEEQLQVVLDYIARQNPELYDKMGKDLWGNRDGDTPSFSV